MNWLSKLFAVALIALAVGCASTLTPKIAESQLASFDGTNQNSGLVAFVNGGAAMTTHAHDRYVDLVKEFGVRFHPPLTNDAGWLWTATDGSIWPTGSTPAKTQIVYDPNANWWVDNQHLAYFAAMNRWRKQDVEAGQRHNQ